METEGDTFAEAKSMDTDRCKQENKRNKKFSVGTTLYPYYTI